MAATDQNDLFVTKIFNVKYIRKSKFGFEFFVG